VRVVLPHYLQTIPEKSRKGEWGAAMKVKIVLSVFIAVIVLLLILGDKKISTEIVINAPVERVWNELTAFGKYPDWNPFIRKLTGDIREGGAIEVTFQIRDSSPVVFTPVIRKLIQNETLQWEGRLLMPGIFTGRHTFRLVEVENNRTGLIQREEFNGLLVPFFNFDSTVEGFELMNKALKERIEKQ